MKKLVYKSTDRDLAQAKEDSLIKKGYRTQLIRRHILISDLQYGDFWKEYNLVYVLSKDHAEK